MAYDEAVAGGVRKAVTETGEVTGKKMFGGIAIMLRGNMGCGVIGDKLMVRVGPKGHGTALTRPHPRYRLSILTRGNEETIEACPKSWRNFDPAGPDRESIDRAIDIWWQRRGRTAPAAERLKRHQDEEEFVAAIRESKTDP